MSALPTGRWSATAAEVVSRVAADRRVAEALQPALAFAHVRGLLKNHQRNTIHLALDTALVIARHRRHGDEIIAFQLEAVQRHLFGAISADRLQQLTTASDGEPTAGELHRAIASLTAATLNSLGMFSVEERATVADCVATVLHAIDSTCDQGARAWLSMMLNFREPRVPRLREDYIETLAAFR